MMFGLGGIMVEVLKDVSFRLVPLTDKDAGQMIGGHQGQADSRRRSRQPAGPTSLR